MGAPSTEALAFPYTLVKDHDARMMRLVVHELPDIPAAQLGVEVVDGGRAVEVILSEGHVPMLIHLSETVDPDECGVKWSRKRRELTLLMPMLAQPEVVEKQQAECVSRFHDDPPSSPAPTSINAYHKANNATRVHESLRAEHQQLPQTAEVCSCTTLGQQVYDVAMGPPPPSSPAHGPRSTRGGGMPPNSLPRKPGRDESRPADRGTGGGDSNAADLGTSEVRLVEKGGVGAGAAEGSVHGVAVFHACKVPPRVTSLSALKATPSTNNKKKGKAGGGRLSELAEAAGRSLKEHGWAVVDNFINFDQVTKVRAEIAQLESQYESGEIWVGKEADLGAQISVKSVRGDKVLWVDRPALLDGPFSALRELVRMLDKLVVKELAARVPRLRQVAERSDPMLAIYPGRGARFQKHVDNTAEDGRVLTVLCYLNPHWDQKLGGALRLHPQGGNSAPVDLCPAGGRLGMFWADKIPHEVLPSSGVRHSVTLWYYDSHERQRAMASGRVTSVPTHQPQVLRSGNTADNDYQAQAFIKNLVTQHVEPEALLHQAEALSPEALATAAAVTGAPTTDHFLESLRSMNANQLSKLRKSLIDMGL